MYLLSVPQGVDGCTLRDRKSLHVYSLLHVALLGHPWKRKGDPPGTDTSDGSKVRGMGGWGGVGRLVGRPKGAAEGRQKRIARGRSPRVDRQS